MKVLLVNGSPHKEGCTYTALCEVSKALNENGVDTDVFWIGNKALSGCIACRKCRKQNLSIKIYTPSDEGVLYFLLPAKNHPVSSLCRALQLQTSHFMNVYKTPMIIDGK